MDPDEGNLCSKEPRKKKDCRQTMQNPMEDTTTETGNNTK